MKQLTFMITALLLSINTQTTATEYPSKETKEVVEKMIKAHGGFKKWKNLETFNFDNVMFSESLPGQPFWVSKITVDQESRRVYQKWPLHNATMAYDGEKTWSVDWKIGNPPKFEALFFYYFLNLPWITQDKNVKLSTALKISHDAFENEVYEVEMSFTEKPAVGKTQIDKYKLYIDSESYLLVGYEYMIGYGHMLDLFRFPAEKDLFGPMFRVNNAFVEVDGLIFPNRMQTSNLDQSQIYGYHTIFDYDFSNAFDESKMQIPKDAIIDESSHIRAPK